MNGVADSVRDLSTADLRPLVADADLLDMWDYESDFGFREISAVIAEAFSGRTNLRCLEVGCGAGLLLHKLRRAFPQHRFEGIEPGAGYAVVDVPGERVTAALQLDVRRTTLEAFQPGHAYDLIFSVNVMEHVRSWKDFLVRSRALLAPGGAAVALCPNHAFPFESHFGLPIVINKAVTAKLFGAYIAKFERRCGGIGLWDSLNFVKKGDVARFLKSQGAAFWFDEKIMDRMCARFFSDPHFQKRLRVFAGISKLAYRSGLTRLIALPVVRSFAPYMKLVVSN